MDINAIKNNLPAKIQEVVTKVSSDKTMLEQFQKEPVKVVEKIVGMDLPDDVVNQIINGVKAKLTTDKASGVVSDVAGAIKKFL